MAKRRVAVGDAAYLYARSAFLMTDAVDVPDRLSPDPDGTVHTADTVLARAKALVHLDEEAKGAQLDRLA